jgi:hypothetical protein
MPQLHRVALLATLAAGLSVPLTAAAETQAERNTRVEAEKTAARVRESDTRLYQNTSGLTGLSRSLDPVWTLFADSNVSSLDVSQPSAGLGLEVATSFHLARIALRKNVADSTLTGLPAARDFGRAVLRPALANVSLAIHAERRFISYVRCRVDCTASADSDDAAVTAKWGLGAFGSLEVADLDLNVVDDAGTTLVSGHLVPIALTAGLTARIEGIPPESLVTARGGLMISGTIGPTVRILSGDVSDSGRRLVVSTDRRVLFGGELAVAVQLGNLILDARATALSNFDQPIPGLSGVQLQTGLTFLLPWEVVGGGDRQEKAKTVPPALPPAVPAAAPAVVPAVPAAVPPALAPAVPAVVPAVAPTGP